jgi:hypothetical protein
MSGELQTRALKIFGAFELIGSLVETSIDKNTPRENEHRALLNHTELVANTFAELTCDVLERLNRVMDKGGT